VSTRRLALAVWAAAALATGLWWPLSYRYGAGFVATAPGAGGTGPGFAVLSGMGKVIAYLSWSSRFSRRGAFIDPVMPHEFPHPWFGFQLDGGRLWISVPVAFFFGITAAGAAWHLRPAARFRPDPVEPET